jgi:protein TonB
MAKQARIQGVVRFTAIIGKDGTIQNLQLITGHPLLIEAARQAVQQWQYKPTLLNGEPVEVVTQIDVNFSLSQ